MYFGTRDLEPGQPALARAKQITLATEPQVLFGDAKAIFGFAQDGKACLGGFAERRLVDQQTGRGSESAADTPAQLVQLGKTEAFRMLNDHDGGFRHVDTDFD